MSKVIVLASHNKGKLREFESILSPLGYEVRSVDSMGYYDEPVENGESYSDNAYIKSKYYFDLLGIPVISDDSGIEIDTLGEHFPGVHSSRWAESIMEKKGKGYTNVNSHILETMKGNPNRAARYICSICLIDEKGMPHHFEGVCEGKILEEISGDHGFGYDPIFFSNESNSPFGMIDDEEKSRYSHRGKAVRKLVEYLKNNQ